ncbi:Ribosomal RNA large subunit methyltransferase E [Tolypocladium capitatum]|uniref:rRNA methyltransferase 2, mitochondrial n=1 Tax=Tolypocladium capitatum TaxID=45235 RepID=A0A2K3QHA8_9HYPO|nr:Ribosomal RNA large subunit methyltransferase E [Tolypocladium capitatum]
MAPSALSPLCLRSRLCPRPCTAIPPLRASYSSASSRWKQRQGRDMYAREAKVQGLKSRAAFKLLEMDAKYRLFRSGQTVVDLARLRTGQLVPGMPPPTLVLPNGTWGNLQASIQVVMERTRPHGRVIGIDLIPAQPPRGVATFQGDFLSPSVRALVKDFITRTAPPAPEARAVENDDALPIDQPSYIDRERHMADAAEQAAGVALVDVVLSDMSEPWHQTSGYTANTLSNPHHRLMNTSGNAFRDHAGSMDLCAAALQFASDTLKPGGHFVAKFYQGAEDKALELRLKRLFAKVHREKPDSSRSESKEAYFIALRRKQGVVDQKA